MAVQINVAANQAALTASIQAGVQAYNQRFAQNNQINLSINQRGFSQPLGRITGDVKDFEAALAASNARVIAFGASTAVLGGVIRSFKELANVTIEVEKNLADINRVFGLTTSQLQKFSTDLFNVTKLTASSFDDASKAALEFSRQGLKAEETLQRTKDALTLTRLAGISTANAVDALTSTVNGFAATGISTTQILNKLVAVEQDYAVGAGDLAEALSRTGQAAQEAGVSLDQLNALVTSAQQSTARGGAVIGNALKTIFTRLQRTDTLDQLEAFNISVRDVQGNILPAVQILQNFAGAYKGLADAQRAQLSEQVAGVYQVNILKAIVNDLNKSQGTYAGALQRGAAATNEAEVATAKLNQTLDALLKQTATSTQQLANNIGKVTFEPLAKYGTEQLKSFIESLNEVLEGEGVGSTFANGLLKGIRNVIAGPGAIAAFFTLFKLIQNSFTYLSQALPQIAGITTETQNRKNIEQSILQIMAQQGTVAQALDGLTGNQAAQAQLLLQTARAQTAEYQKQAALAKQLAAQLSGQGVKVAGSRGLQVTRAGGYIPNATKMAEVVGAQAGGYTPGRVVSSPVGGVMNTAEDVKYIPGFAQPFINPPANSKAGRAHRQKAISRTDIDPYMAAGFIPNFVKGINPGERGNKFEKLINKSLTGIESQAGSGLLDFPLPYNPLITAKSKDKNIISLNAKSIYGDAKINSTKDTQRDLIKKLVGSLDSVTYGKLITRANKIKSDTINLNEFLPYKPSLISNKSLVTNDNENASIDSVLGFDVIEKLARLYKNNKNTDRLTGEAWENKKLKLNFIDDYVTIPDFSNSGFIPNFATPISTASIPWFKKYSSKYKNATGDTDLFKMGDFPTYGRGLDHEYAKKGNSAMLSYLHEDFVRSALNIALGSKKVIRPAEVGFKNKPVSDIANENDFDLLYRIADGSYSMLELKQDFKNVSGSVTGFMNKKLANLEKENPALAKKVSSMIAVSNRPKFIDPTGKNPAGQFSEFEMAAASIVKDKYSNVDPSISAKLTKVTDGLLRRYETKKNTTYGGFIPNFAYKQAVMGLEESMSGNKAIFDTKPFPHIRNSSQSTFSSAIADHGGLGNALSDSMRGQKAAGLMSGGFIPNFGNLKSTKNKIAKNKAGNQSQNTQSSFNPNQLQADAERIAQNVIKKLSYAYNYVDGFVQTFITEIEDLSKSAKSNIIPAISKAKSSIGSVSSTVSSSFSNLSNKINSPEFKKNLSSAFNNIGVFGPLIAGQLESIVVGNKKRTEMTENEKMLQSGLSTGITAVTTGADIGNRIFPGLGGAVGAAVGGLIGLTAALDAAKLTAEDLAEMADNQKQNSQQNISAGQKYIQAQQEYAKLLASGASSDKLELASKSLSESFNQITDIKLADELSKTKGGVEALNSVLSKYETDKNILTAALSFASGVKGGKTQGGVQIGERVKELKSLGLNKDLFDQLQSFKLQREKIMPEIIPGQETVPEEIEVVTEASSNAAKRLAENIAKSTIGNKGTAEQIKIFQESILELLLRKDKEEILKDLSSGNQFINNIIENARKEGNLLKLRNDLSSSILKQIGEANAQLEQDDFGRKLLDEINNFKFSLAEGILSPLSIATEKLKTQRTKTISEGQDKLTELNLNFVKENQEKFLKLNPSSEVIQSKIRPALEKAQTGDLSGLQAILQESSITGPSPFDPAIINDLKKIYEEFNRSVDKQNRSNVNQLKLTDLQGRVEQIRAKTTEFQATLLQKQIQLLGDQERIEATRKTNSELEIDAIERKMADQGNFLGRGVIGKAESKIALRNETTTKKLVDLEISRSKSAQSDYQSLIEKQQTNLTKMAAQSEFEGRPMQAIGLREQARNIKSIDITNSQTLSQAVSQLQQSSFADPTLENERVRTIEKLKTVQNDIVNGKLKEEEITKRLNNEELRNAKRSTSIVYGFKEGFDALRDEADTGLNRLAKDTPILFRDGMVDAIKATIRETDNLDAALMGVASKFLDTFSTQLMNTGISKIISGSGLGSIFGAQTGGLIRAQSGMYISGTGSGDKYPAMLENGEYVLNRRAVMAMGGPAALDTLNFSAAPRFASGGSFGFDLASSKSDAENIAKMESLMTSEGLENSPLYKELSDAEKQRREEDRRKKLAAKQQRAAMIGSLVAAAATIAIGAGISNVSKNAQAKDAKSFTEKINAQGGIKTEAEFLKQQKFVQQGLMSASTPLSSASYIGGAPQTGFKSLFSGPAQGQTWYQKFGSTVSKPFRRQTGGMIGSRLSDTIPGYMEGGLYDSSIVKRYGTGMQGGGSSIMAAGNNSSTVNNNTNANNSFNFNTTVQRDGTIKMGANTTSYQQQDVELSKNLNAKMYAVVTEVIRKEKQFGGSLAGIRN